MSTDPIRVIDPAAVTDAGSSVLTLNAFQRLMTARPGESVLKPDAAQDCVVTAPTVYTCTLQDKLVFHNGHPLTSSDVKFSIARAARLAVPGSSAGLLSSLRRIDTPDPRTVRFLLSRVDTQFGWALASPAASIVDEEVYSADELATDPRTIMGSGPFSVLRYEPSRLELARHGKYLGPNPARMPALTYRAMPDSPAIEDAMRRGTTDVVWRGLSAAAVTRYSAQISESPDGQTADGYGSASYTGLRVRQLWWSPRSRSRASADLRRAVNVALQDDRTSDSVVPGGVPGHIAAFPVGGVAKPKVTWNTRITLTLSYDPAAPDARDVALQLRARLEDTGGLSVRLEPGASDADLALVDRKAWTATPLAWLQPYLDAPLPASAATLASQTTRYRASTVQAQAQADQLLAALQRQAATDATILPVSQADEYLFTRTDVDVDEFSFGPGWQLGLYGFRGK